MTTILLAGILLKIKESLFLPELSVYLFDSAYKSLSSLYLLNLNKNFDPFNPAITLIGKEGSEELKSVISLPINCIDCRRVLKFIEVKYTAQFTVCFCPRGRLQKKDLNELIKGGKEGWWTGCSRLAEL